MDATIEVLHVFSIASGDCEGASQHAMPLCSMLSVTALLQCAAFETLVVWHGSLCLPNAPAFGKLCKHDTPLGLRRCCIGGTCRAHYGMHCYLLSCLATEFASIAHLWIVSGALSGGQAYQLLPLCLKEVQSSLHPGPHPLPPPFSKHPGCMCSTRGMQWLPGAFPTGQHAS